MANQLILFGAGASFGSEPEGEPTPPLLSGLCQELAQIFPDTWGAITRNEKNRFNRNFEKEMLRFMEHLSVYNRINNFPIRLQWDLARFLFEFEPTSKSLYVNFADVIKSQEWSGTIVTLNYDRLLEIALRSAEIPISKFGVTEQPEGQEVLLPHGCSNLCVGGNNVVRDNVILGNPTRGIVIDHPPVTVESKAELEEHFERAGDMQPVMAFIEPGKGSASSPSFFENTKTRFKECALAADQIIIIGVNCNDQDDHIWGPLAESNAEITYCSGKETQPFDIWCHKNKKANAANLEKYWEEAFDEVCDILEAGVA